MADDCRNISDNLNDQVAQSGVLIAGSDAVDISGASMTAGANGWSVLVKTAAPAQQNPRLATTVALYLDVDGRPENNAIGGPRLGADTVYALVYDNGAWRLTKEVLNVKTNVFEVAPTVGTYSIAAQGYVLNIPYAEVPKNASAYWKTGVAVKDAGRLTVDYAPDVGMSCAPVLASEGRVYIPMDRLAEIVAGAIVIIIAAMLIWKRSHKKEKYDQQTKPN